MTIIRTLFPPLETTLELEPTELAPFVLRYLNALSDHIERKRVVELHYAGLKDYAGEHQEELSRALAEAWAWLEKEIFIAKRGSYFFITRPGQKVLKAEDFSAYHKGKLLPSEGLDLVLVSKIKPLFIRGEYDSAVFQAFKEVEIRVRAKAGYGNDKTGVPLMREAFNSNQGPLVNECLESGEKDAIGHLFAGAMGIFRNPAGHRDVEYDDPNEVADIIHIANQLLRMCERCAGGIQQNEASV